MLKKDSAVQVIRWLEHEESQRASKTPYNYNSLAWSQAGNGDPLLCVTGNISQIRILNVATGQLVQVMLIKQPTFLPRVLIHTDADRTWRCRHSQSSHGAARKLHTYSRCQDINDLAVSPINPTIVASASVDCSVRIWSLHPSHSKQPLAAICYGQGHKDQVLTLVSRLLLGMLAHRSVYLLAQAYHRKGRFLLSAGMDTKVNLVSVILPMQSSYVVANANPVGCARQGDQPSRNREARNSTLPPLFYYRSPHRLHRPVLQHKRVLSSLPPALTNLEWNGTTILFSATPPGKTTFFSGALTSSALTVLRSPLPRYQSLRR